MTMWKSMRISIGIHVNPHCTRAIQTLGMVLLCAIDISCQTCRSDATNSELLQCAEHNVFLQEMPFLVAEVKNPLRCIGMCKRLRLCQSVNYRIKFRWCYFNRAAAESSANLTSRQGMVYVKVNMTTTSNCYDDEIAIPAPKEKTICKKIGGCAVHSNYTYDAANDICFRVHAEYIDHTSANSTCIDENAQLFTEDPKGLALLADYHQLGFFSCITLPGATVYYTCWIDGISASDTRFPVFDPTQPTLVFRTQMETSQIRFICRM